MITLSMPTHVCAPAICPSAQQLRLRLEGELEAAEQSRLDRHIEHCEACQQRMEQLVDEMTGGQTEATGDLDWWHSDLQLHQPVAEVITYLREFVPAALTSRREDTGLASHTLDEEGRESDERNDHDCDLDRLTDKQGQLRFLDVAGEGATSVVFRCRDETTGRDVAVKVLRHRYAANPEVRERFGREARIQSRLAHHGVAEVFETGEMEDGRLYTVMEYRTGRTLSQRLRTQHESPSGTLNLLEAFHKVCQIMAFVHEQGVQHRDLKPSNIQIEPSGEVAVLDWGLAKEHSGEAGPGENSDPSLPVAVAALFRTAAGTPGYSAPEQVRGLTCLPSADVYSLGVILSEILTGERVSADESAFDCGPATNHLSSRIVERVRSCGVPSDLVDLVESCVAVHPDDRPSDAREVLAALRFTQEPACIAL